MKRTFGVLLLLLFFAANLQAVMIESSAQNNYVADGDFGIGTVIHDTGSYWDVSKDSLNTWYTQSSCSRGNFYEVYDQYARVNASWDVCGGRKSVKLMQVINGLDEGIYNLSFDYQITNDWTQYSVFRVFGVDADHKGRLKISTSGWDIKINKGSADRLYDQGGKYSYLRETNGWTTVNSSFNVNKKYDYMVVYGAFSYDGYSCSNDLATLDNISIGSNAVPEPTTLLMFGAGALGLAIRRRKK